MKEIPSDRWIPDDKYKKFRWQMNAQMREALKVFDLYGMGIYIDNAAEACSVAGEIFCEAVRGRDIPITTEVVKYRRRKKK